ncbi:hypothetical protein BIY45_00880 [Stenotrophomonas sp. BIIR7]|nr:hypothetical protein BIY45_00880 [Stenotrophomonas sp. BIIR7]
MRQHCSQCRLSKLLQRDVVPQDSTQSEARVLEDAHQLVEVHQVVVILSQRAVGTRRGVPLPSQTLEMQERSLES